MNAWGNEQIPTGRQIQEFASELWKSKEQFERELRNEQDMRDRKMDELIKHENMKTKYLKETCLFRL